MRSIVGFGLLAAVIVGVQSLGAAAGTVAVPVRGSTTTYESRTDTIFTIGLRFSFGSSQPSVVAGVRHLKTDKDNDVTGILGELDIVLGNTFIAPSVRVMGLFGNRTVQGKAGAGFNFNTNQILGELGVQGLHSEAGVTINSDFSIDPFIGVNSFRRAKDRKEITEMMGMYPIT